MRLAEPTHPSSLAASLLGLVRGIRQTIELLGAPEGVESEIGLITAHRRPSSLSLATPHQQLRLSAPDGGLAGHCDRLLVDSRRLPKATGFLKRLAQTSKCHRLTTGIAALARIVERLEGGIDLGLKVRHASTVA